MTEDYQIYCKKCDYKLTLKKVTFKYANRNVKEYNKLRSVKNPDCNHDLALREI